ncbi:MAG: hypothetical protein IT368_08610 [Candidatus Hydrogenedentes bacterium]|nr:hypothetical protein [Candidatus Hydrogenedentota bacterium]
MNLTNILNDLLNEILGLVNGIIAGLTGGYNEYLQDNAILVNTWNFVVQTFFD